MCEGKMSRARSVITALILSGSGETCFFSFFPEFINELVHLIAAYSVDFPKRADDVKFLIFSILI